MDPYLIKLRRKERAAFLSWLLVIMPSFLTLLLWLSLQGLLDIVLALSNINTWSWGAIKTFTFICLGVVWLVVFFLMQNMLYKSAARGKMLSKCMQMSALILGFLACSQAARFALGAADFSIRSVSCVVLLAVLAAVLYVLNWSLARRAEEYRLVNNSRMTRTDKKAPR